MSVSEKAQVFKSDYQAQLDKIEALKAPLQEKIVLADELVAEHESSVKAEYDRGYLEGKASVVLPDTGTGEKLFTQEDMNALAETAKAEKAAELQPQIDAAQAAHAEAKAQAEQLAIDIADLQARFDADQAKDAEAKAQIIAAAEQI